MCHYLKNTPLIVVGWLCECENGLGKGIFGHKGISEPPGGSASKWGGGRSTCVLCISPAFLRDK